MITTFKCPYCRTKIKADWVVYPSAGWIWDSNVKYELLHAQCNECNRLIMKMICNELGSSQLLYPRTSGRDPVAPEVDEEFSTDYLEACAVLDDSPKASAALSRRCLQHILREKAVVKVFNSKTNKLESSPIKKGNLFSEIQQVLDNGGLPAHISDGLDAVRVIGNFAAHPIKSTSTGEIVEVERGEAEWNLDVIESLFDYYFVQPARLAARREALDKKLAETGK